MKTDESSANLLDLAKNVLLSYDIFSDDIKIIQNTGLKTVWKVRNGNNRICLKRLKHLREKALFTVNAQNYIAAKGGRVPKVCPNKSGELITEYMEQLFVLYEWIEGRDLNFAKSSDLSLALEGLAKFHLSSTGYQSPEGAQISSKLGRWPEQYESMKKRMLKWKEEAKLQSQQPSYNSYLEYIDEIIDLADQALDAIKQSPYGILTDKELSESTLCHQDFGEGNIIFSGEELYVIDLDGVTYDLVIRDLRKMIGKSMEKQGGWTVKQIETILTPYEQFYHLSSQEREILKIDLLFPHWFFAKAKNLFKKNKPMKANSLSQIGQLEIRKLLVLKEWS